MDNTFDREKIIDAHLRDAQKNKQFKDSEERVGGSAKEKRALRKLIQDGTLKLSDLEKNKADAEELITKDELYPKVDIDEERLNGVTSGALFLKVKLRQAFPPKPPIDSPSFRSFYFKMVDFIVQEMKGVYNYRDFIDFQDKFRNSDKLLKVLFETALTDDQKNDIEWNEIEEGDVKKAMLPVLVNKSLYDNLNLRNYQVIRKGLGSRLENFFHNKEVFDTAFSYEPMSIPVSMVLTAEETKNSIEYLNDYNAKIEEVNSLKSIEDFDAFFSKRGNGDIGYWIGKGVVKGKEYLYYIDCNTVELKEWYKTKFISRMNTNISSTEKRISLTKDKYKPRENDWSWLKQEIPKKDEKAEEGDKEDAKIKINTYLPLSHITRTGGYLVTPEDVTVESIQNKLGFKNIEFGKVLPDKEAILHVRHFISSMVDLGDILDLDIIKLNELGNISIGFASRGHGKASAHYEPKRKIINITRARGGGAVAHEYFHYLDNVLSINKEDKFMVSENVSSDVLYSTGYYGRFDINNNINVDIARTFNAISYYIHKGKTNINGEVISSYNKVKKTIKAQDKKRYSLSHIMRDTIDGTFLILTNRYESFRNSRNIKGKNLDILGYIVNHFGLKEYEFEFTSEATMYYESSKIMGAYWVEEVELFARAFETYVFDKLKKVGRENNYLVSGGYFNMPFYPQGKEREVLYELFDNLIVEIKKVLEVGSFKNWIDIRTDEFIKLEEAEPKKRKGKKSEDEQDEEVGVIVDAETDETIEVIDTMENSLSDKLNTLLDMLSIEKFELGGNLTSEDESYSELHDNYKISEETKNNLLNLQNIY